MDSRVPRDELTIAAPATGTAPAGVAIVRISGPRAVELLQRLFRPSRLRPGENPGRLCFGSFSAPDSSHTIDRGFAVFMPSPATFTGEDVAELHVHGSPLIVERLLAALYAEGAVPALPGEFSKRAFLNGKLDLLQAEALSEVIAATSERALKIAQEQLDGRLSSVVSEIAEPLRNALAEIEAHLDFPEEDIAPQTLRDLRAALGGTRERLASLLASFAYGRKVREGLRVLLCGPPNAGKSSLLNALLGTERAIVTDLPGTTRDVIEEAAIYEGCRIVFCDSAGLRADVSDIVERKGVELARARIPWADVILAVVEAGSAGTQWELIRSELHDHEHKVWQVLSKCDLGRVEDLPVLNGAQFPLSAYTGQGLQVLRQALVRRIQADIPADETGQSLTSERHRSCVALAEEALRDALDTLESGLPLEITAAELRRSLSALEDLVGVTYTEDILGRIFSKFCIGK